MPNYTNSLDSAVPKKAQLTILEEQLSVLNQILSGIGEGSPDVSGILEILQSVHWNTIGEGLRHYLRTSTDQLPSSVGKTDANYSLSVTQASQDVFAVEPLGIPKNNGSHKLVVSSSGANVYITGCTRISIKAQFSDARFEVAATLANAATSHFIEAGERLDIAIPADTYFAVIRDSASTVDGVLHISELI